LIDLDRQWFKSRFGLAAPETHRNLAFCAYTVLETSPDVFVVLESRQDPRFINNDLVTGPPYVIFYAGAALYVDGMKLGSLCIIDHTPRPQFALQDQQNLFDFGLMVCVILKAKRDAYLHYKRECVSHLLSLNQTLRTTAFALDVAVRTMVNSNSIRLSTENKILVQEKVDHLLLTITNVLDVAKMMPSLSPPSNNSSDVLSDRGVFCNIIDILQCTEKVLVCICDSRDVRLVFTISSELPDHSYFQTFPDIVVVLLMRASNIIISNGSKFLGVQGTLEKAVDSKDENNFLQNSMLCFNCCADASLILPHEIAESIGQNVSAVGGGCLINGNSLKLWVPCSYSEGTLPGCISMQALELEPSTKADTTEKIICRVLVVEFSQKLRDNLVELFAKYNCDVTTCVNGQEGLTRLLHDEPYDLVIVDFLMPCLNGFETIRRYHEIYPRVVGERIVVGLLIADESLSDFIPNNLSEDQSLMPVNSEEHFDYIFQKPLDDDQVKMLLMKSCKAISSRICGNTKKTKLGIQYSAAMSKHEIVINKL
jgi:CheY-like chemotaxis protein